MVALSLRAAAVGALVGAFAALPVHAQDAPGAAGAAGALRIAAHPADAYVTAAGPGAAIRVTTFAQRPDVSARLDHWRGVRVFRDRPAGVHVVPAVPAARVVRSPDGRFVRHGGATYPVVPR